MHEHHLRDPRLCHRQCNLTKQPKSLQQASLLERVNTVVAYILFRIYRIIPPKPEIVARTTDAMCICVVAGLTSPRDQNQQSMLATFLHRHASLLPRHMFVTGQVLGKVANESCMNVHRASTLLLEAPSSCGPFLSI